MKIFKRIRGFLRSRIPFTQKKKTDKIAQINYGFEEFDEYDMYEEVGEATHTEPNAPVPSEHPQEEKKSNSLLKNAMDYNDGSDECLQFPPEANVTLDIPIPTKVLDEKSKMPSKDLGNKYESVNRLTTQQPKFYKDFNERLLDRRDNTVEQIGQMLRRNLAMSSKKKGLKKDVKKVRTESVDMSTENDIIKEERNLDKKTEGAHLLTTQRLQFCEDYNEKVKDIRQISAEKCEILGRSSNPDNNHDFVVDFETAFGPNIKTTDCADPWPPIH